MKSIVSISIIVLACIGAMAMAPQHSGARAGSVHADRAATYEHLAAAIIAIRETENSLVRGMLADYLAAARTHLDGAADASGDIRQRKLEAAAGEIANLANEGDERIRAVRQRLLQAGHHHHTDSETDEDYMFIDSGEKAALLAVAGEVARLRNASTADVRAMSERVSALAERAVQSE